jgi:hypothetical protein
MNKAQKEAMAQNVAVLARNYPSVNAQKLQNDLFKLALACEHNARELCNTADHVDQRDQLRSQFAKISQKHGVELKADITGDPRGFSLKLHLPDGSYNTWGGKESGFGIGSV